MEILDLARKSLLVFIQLNTFYGLGLMFLMYENVT